MAVPPEHDRLSELETLVNQLVQLDGASLKEKMDALERLIEQWRIGRHQLGNALQFEDFLEWKWLVDSNRLYFAPGAAKEEKGFGTPPIRLQRKLLVFLLLHHGCHQRVLTAIDAFVAKIRSDLQLLDFKKTETGVFRCYTNTRFAANKLREHGLLRYTEREAFKVWVLSLPGILVAARALASPDWTLPHVRKDPWHDLDPFILESSAAIADFADFVGALKRICHPNTVVFKAFEPVLQNAYQLLQSYWAILQNRHLDKAERTKLSRELIDRLDKLPQYHVFLKELCDCIQIEDLLSKADAAAKNL